MAGFEIKLFHHLLCVDFMDWLERFEDLERSCHQL